MEKIEPSDYIFNSFTEKEKKFAEYKLYGPPLTVTDEEQKYKDDYFKLNGDAKIKAWIDNKKRQKEIRKEKLIDNNNAENFMKLTSLAITILNNSMVNPKSVTADQVSSAKYVLTPTKAYLTKLADQQAIKEIGLMTEDGDFKEFPPLKFDPKLL